MPVRRQAALVNALVFVAAIVQGAVIPLLPRFADRFDLSPAETGMLLGSTALSTLLVAAPSGYLTDRVGARRVTLLAAALLSASTLATAVAPSFATLLASRLAFGVAFGIVWTTGLAWIASTSDDRGGRRLGTTVAISSVGQVTGPAIAGVAAAHGLAGAPFVLAATAAALIGTLLAGSTPSSTATPRAVGGDEAGSPVSARSDLRLIAAMVTLGLVSAAGCGFKLLIPLELDASGATVGAIGSIFTANSAVYIVVSLVTVSLGARLVSVPTCIAGLLALALTVTPAIVGSGAGMGIAALLLSALPISMLCTVCYPLAAEAGLGAGASIGLLNTGWAVSTVTAPVVIGALAGAVGMRGIYLALAAMLGLVAFGLFIATRRGRSDIVSRIRPVVA